MNRRSFIKGLIALASAPAIGKYVNVFKTEGAREGIGQVVGEGVDFFNMVIKKVMDEGTLVNESERIQTFKHPDRPDINVEVDLGTGNANVSFATDQGTEGVAAIEKDLEVGMSDPGELIDDGLEGGITNLEEFLRNKNKMFRGGVPKGLQAALRSIMSKYGDDAITTADKAPQPEKTIQELIMDFNARNPAGDIFTDEVKIKAAVDDIFPTGDYKMDAQMAAESFVENNPQAFNDMLFDDLDQRTQMKIYDLVLTEIQSNMAKIRELKKLTKPEKTLGAMKAGKGIDMSDPDIAAEFTRFMQESDPSGFKDLEQKVDLSNFSTKGRKKNADGGSVDGDVSLTVIKIPDISESGVESLFKRR
jgi:hypothetical protein